MHMKQKNITLHIILSLTILFACEREYTNPWDEKANLAPSAWAPQNLQIEDISITEKKLTWTYTDQNIEGFKLDRKKGDEAWQVACQTFPKETRSWNDTEIVPDPSLTYSYRVYAYAGGNSSAKQNDSANAAFAAPNNLQTEKLTDKSYQLNWTDNSTGEQGFKIDRKIDENNWAIAYGTLAQNQTSFTDTNVFRATDVEYRVYAFYENYESSKATTNTTAELTAPTNLQIEKITDKSYQLQWTDNSDSEEGFKIDRRVDMGSWVEIYGKVPANQNSFIDTNVFRATNIDYSVYAFSGNVESTKAIANTSAELTPPTYLQIAKNSITTVTLNWQDNSTGEDGFKIERKYEGGSWESLATVTANNYEDDNFNLNTQVYYRVCAYYSTFLSSWVETNFDAIIPPPENLEIIPTATSATLNWDYNYTGNDGFMIDRKINEGSWETTYATVTTGKSFTDNGLDLNNNVYYYRVYAFYDQYKSTKTESLVTLKCGYPFTDNRDGNEYQTVQIGDQCWMKENLAWLPSVSDPDNGSQTSPYYYVYGYEGTNVIEAKATSNYQTYGTLYNWPASLSACPDGWALPSDDEWTVLTDYLGGTSVAGGKMKEAGTAHWNSPNTGATNSSGFSGLPGGYRNNYGNFNYLGYNGYWWSSTEYSSTYAWRRGLYYGYENVDRYDSDKEYGFSVRCLRDL